MATISIDYNSENKEVYLCGDIEAIKRNRFAWRYVRDYFSPREEMGRIVIPVMDEEPFPISEIDVTAGYDIVSANSPNSTVANRFIEVKAVSENGFYWSKNEYDIAKLLAADYYLYLVDLSKIDDDNYEPDIIHNPVQHIMENNLWLVEPQSYHIQKVKF